jgi:hypothetical protein
MVAYIRVFLYRIPLAVIIFFSLSLTSCDPEEDDNDPFIVGLWNIEMTTIALYDSMNMISHIDTIYKWMNNIGKEVEVFERYTSDHKYYFLTDTSYDISIASTYTLDGSNLIIHEADSVFPFNDRTLENITATSFQSYQILYSGTVKYKMTLYNKLIP